MTGNDEKVEAPENKSNDGPVADIERGKTDEGDVLSEKEKAEIEANPDLEDPRLYSPLQEPDIPDAKLRAQTGAHPDEEPSEERQESLPPKEE